MSTPINLNKARKAKDKAKQKANADQNAVKHGQTKAERILEASRGTKLRAHLDAHRFETE